MFDTDQYADLPVQAVLPDLRAQLHERNEAVLQAPPGAGKTTLVPLALLNEPWLRDQKIIMLQPRRIATRNAAHRLSTMLGEPIGNTVGYRMRLDSRISVNTRIEVITEGVLTRMLQEDPSLAGVGMLIFDEFHERNLESDLGLALALQGRALFRDGNNPLKILVMSATLASEDIARLLDDAPVVSSEGRQYPVDVIYTGASKLRERIVERTVRVVQQALRDNPDSSMLVFLPGQGEIHGAADQLETLSAEPGLYIRPLYGNLSMDEQQRAIAPEAGGSRKIVLATNIAETSLTIDGINVVIDSGLAREPRFDPNTGMTRLQIQRISRASATQRSGRAGRLAAGRCYRLWSRDQQQQMAAHGAPEILSADLAPLVLQLLQWGVTDPDELRWLDKPPAGSWDQALTLLDALGALSADRGSLSSHGNAMMQLAAHPRIAHMLLRSVGENELVNLATQIAAILADRDPFSRDSPDMALRIAILNGETSCPGQHRGWLRRTRDLAGQYRQRLRPFNQGAMDGMTLARDDALGYLIAAAYPDRIARKRQSGGYQLANGRSAALAKPHRLGREPWLAIAETGGQAGAKGDTIYSGAALAPELFESLLADLLRTETSASWDDRQDRFTAETRQRIGALVLKRIKLDPDPALKNLALLGVLAKRGMPLLNPDEASRQLQGRVMLLRDLGYDYPDLSDKYLLANAQTWLAPYLDPVNRLADFRKLKLFTMLRSQLDWQQQSRLEELAPERIQVPGGSQARVDYSVNPPVLAVKLQEMFGVTDTPTVGGGAVKVLVHLLSPAGRPLQVTQDLAGFWQTSYEDVRKEMKGRYPKHSWPDDPLTALPRRR